MGVRERSTVRKPPPIVDRAQASRAGVLARQERAELKRKLGDGQVSHSLVLRQSLREGSVAAKLRVPEFISTFQGVGRIKTVKLLEQLQINPKKRLGGLGILQRARLTEYVHSREKVAGSVSAHDLVVLAGPTAVGKGTVVNYMRDNYPGVQVSVSATTRPPRPGERDGEHYHFVDDETFDGFLARDELIEWATVHSLYRYGTPKSNLRSSSAAGKTLLLEIDLQGAQQVRRNLPGAFLVFLAPPSWEELVARLEGRGTENAKERERRLKTAKMELAAQSEFDAVIVNDEVPRAAEKLFQLIQTGEKQQ